MEFSSEETQNIVEAFKVLGVKPKANSAENLIQWMKHYAGPKKTIPVKEEAITPELMTTHLLSNNVRLPFFSGDCKGDVAYDLWRYEETQRRHHKARHQ